MRFTLIPVFILILAAWLTTASADSGPDSNLILTDETDKKKDKESDENESAGDEEPDCE